jgi:hypothetical protein
MESSPSALLSAYSHATLARMCEFNSIEVSRPEGDKQTLIDALARELFKHKRVTRALSSLSDQERTILSVLLLHGGSMETRALREELKREGIALPERSDELRGESHQARFEASGQILGQLMSHLMLRGLVFSSGTIPGDQGVGLSAAPGGQLIVPEPVLECLRRAPISALGWGRGKLPAPVVATSIDIAQRELLVYWAFVGAQPLPLTQAELVQKRALRSLNQQLLSPDADLVNAADESESPRLHFMRLLLQQLGLLVGTQGSVRATSLQQGASRFWDQSPEQRTDGGLQAWVRLRDWSELSSLGLSSLELDLHRARTALLEQLRMLPAARWLSAERFLAHLQLISPRLLFTTRQARNTVGHERQSERAQLSRRLAEIEAGFVGGSLSGPLHWLGLVDVCTDGGRVLVFRINASGARALRRRAATKADPARQGKLIVQPDFRIFALGPVPDGILARIELLADRVHADRRVFEYQLSRKAVHRAQHNDWSVTDVIAFLEIRTGTTLPQNVRRTLHGWGEQHTRITFHRSLSLLEVDDAQLLKQLWDDSAASIHFERRLTDTVAVVRRRRIPALRDVLLERDLLPMHSLEDSPLENRVQATEGGELQPLTRGPDMLLNARLRRLAEERDGGFHITEQAVKAALDAGVDVRAYLDELSRLHCGPLPASLVSRIKAWGRYYGRAYLREAILLEVRDSEVAKELLADSQLSQMLSPLDDNPDGKILVVQIDDLEALRRALGEQGVALS